MKKAHDFAPVYARLRAILTRHESGLIVQADNDKEYTLVTTKTDKAGKPLYFACVRLGKAYVSFHLVPLYTNPGLMAGCSEALQGRMQGKTCYNFRAIDEALFAELAKLTDRSLEWYREAGMV